jgi:hypothetical protein
MNQFSPLESFIAYDKPHPVASIRARFTERRTYLRPLNDEGTVFETPAVAMDRVMGHQRYLWEQALGRGLNIAEHMELVDLRSLMEHKLVSTSGRVKWMGGTEIVKKRASGAFNCSFSIAETPADLTDIFWLLLQGCFVRGTKVKMADGSYKTIEKIVEGDEVLSYNEQTKTFEPQKVERLNVNFPKPLVRVMLHNGEKIVCTEDHMFLTIEGEWVAAKNLAGRQVVSDA